MIIKDVNFPFQDTLLIHPGPRILGRKPIGTIVPPKEEPEHNIEFLQKPKLYLEGAKEQNLTEAGSKDILTNPVTQDRSQETKELFVFGKPQGDSVFKFSKILGGVRSSVKRLFGFKS